ncbi:hypothetical protein DPQ22_06125 [Candidatus Tokpelaia sp.]|nr:hypothetical protein DPQ22_06125 [Candidatus Tokpelaia sp.]
MAIKTSPLWETVKKRGQIDLNHVAGMMRYEGATGKQHDLRNMAKMLADQRESGHSARPSPGIQGQ